MKTNFTIKFKLIVIFLLIKVIPLLIITYIAYKGAINLEEYLKESTSSLFNKNKEIILNTANESINDSIKNLDKKSQRALERLSYEIANNVADFLYQRDEDILFLSKLEINQKILEEFYKNKNKDILVHSDFIYDDKTSSWIRKEELKKEKREITKALIKDNEKEFNFTDPIIFAKKSIPIYKELSFFNIDGIEQYKVSSINKKLLDVSKKENTYINSEEYFEKIKELKNGEIYVSNVIGEYVGTKIIGTFTKEKAKKSSIEFNPQKYAYAGKENPKGKKFEGIVRFITPVIKDGKKIGYLSLALDHEHIMQFTDTVNPTSVDARQDISDASVGNYAFMWDEKGRNISHPRDYFIVGYDKNTGKQAMPWLSLDLAKKYKDSNQNINDFLESYPKFEEQSSKKKPNIEQFKKDGNVGLDCRYLNFAPQCQGWMQLTQNGGYGSFIIFWSNVWKLSTAASIPYYTGDYKSSKRGFGFITIGANVDEFHAAANETKENVEKILKIQTENMKGVIESNESKIEAFLEVIINELTIVTFIMVILMIVIAILLSNYISKKIERLLLGTKKFANNELDYRIEVTSNDEIGRLEKSFNEMASKIDELLKEEKNLNETLELRVQEEIKKQEEQQKILIQQSKLASMGEMIGNIAHQWRQPLNTLGLILQNIKFSYDMKELDDEFMEKTVSKSRLLIDNMSKTIDDFRSFYKPNKSIVEFEINKSIKNTLALVKAGINEDIEIIVDLYEEDISVLGYPNEFSQAVVNILNNAKDVLEEEQKENKEIRITTSIDKNNCKINISNNGSKIEEKVLDKIFEPYFTTKLDSNGTGIGLYMTKNIIEVNMNGHIYVKNSEQGVDFVIELPLKG